MASPQFEDLTAKARIRNSALAMFAENGPAGTSLRTIADEVGVTVGLITHHFGSKDALIAAVDQHVLQTYRRALASVPLSTPGVAGARDRAIATMLEDEPSIAGYLRRAYLDPADGGVLDQLTDLTLSEVRQLRAANRASAERSEQLQTAYVVVRQLGNLLLQPLADRVWRRVDGYPQRPGPRVRTRLEAP